MVRREVLTAAGGASVIWSGTLWAEVSVGERLGGIGGFLKLLYIPFLLASSVARRAQHGSSFASLLTSLVLLAASWAVRTHRDTPEEVLQAANVLKACNRHRDVLIRDLWTAAEIGSSEAVSL
jgi:hypothetical protein